MFIKATSQKHLYDRGRGFLMFGDERYLFGSSTNGVVHHFNEVT